jgi:hypothetical protein
MKMLEARTEAQHAVDELFSKGQLPFKLTAHQVESIGLQEYIIRFHDSRLHSVIVAWYDGLDFKDACRDAVLEKAKTPTAAPCLTGWPARPDKS